MRHCDHDTSIVAAVDSDRNQVREERKKNRGKRGARRAAVRGGRRDEADAQAMCPQTSSIPLSVSLVPALLALAGGAMGRDPDTGYRLEAGNMRGSFNVGTFARRAGTSLSAAAPAATYYVRLAALNACGASSLSSEVSLVVP
jgi:hypothetical protein